MNFRDHFASLQSPRLAQQLSVSWKLILFACRCTCQGIPLFLQSEEGTRKAYLSSWPPNCSSGACRGLAVKAVVAKRGGRGRGRRGGRGRGSLANGTTHAHTNGNAESSSDEMDASGSDADEGDAE